MHEDAHLEEEYELRTHLEDEPEDDDFEDEDEDALYDAARDEEVQRQIEARERQPYPPLTADGLSPELLPARITSVTEAVRWLKALVKAGLAWHPEERAHSVGNMHAGEFCYLFDVNLSTRMDGLMNQVYATGIDPCRVLLRLQRS